MGALIRTIFLVQLTADKKAISTINPKIIFMGVGVKISENYKLPPVGFGEILLFSVACRFIR
jgi:hypothetical protein